MKKVTLCGSTRFYSAFLEWNARLTLEGNVVYSIAIPVHQCGFEISDSVKRLLDDVHLEKIRNSDSILVLDVNGYIGESTRREIEFAESLGREVRYLSQECPEWAESDSFYS